MYPIISWTWREFRFFLLFLHHRFPLCLWGASKFEASVASTLAVDLGSHECCWFQAEVRVRAKWGRNEDFYLAAEMTILGRKVAEQKFHRFSSHVRATSGLFCLSSILVWWRKFIVNQDWLAVMIAIVALSLLTKSNFVLGTLQRDMYRENSWISLSWLTWGFRYQFWSRKALSNCRKMWNPAVDGGRSVSKMSRQRLESSCYNPIFSIINPLVITVSAVLSVISWYLILQQLFNLLSTHTAFTALRWQRRNNNNNNKTFCVIRSSSSIWRGKLWLLVMAAKINGRKSQQLT